MWKPERDETEYAVDYKRFEYIPIGSDEYESQIKFVAKCHEDAADRQKSTKCTKLKVTWTEIEIKCSGGSWPRYLAELTITFSRDESKPENQDLEEKHLDKLVIKQVNKSTRRLSLVPKLAEYFRDQAGLAESNVQYIQSQWTDHFHPGQVGTTSKRL